MVITPVTLEGTYIRLEPLSLAHHAQLCEVGFDDTIWRWNPRPPIRTPDDMRRYIESALQQQASGAALPFATVERGPAARSAVRALRTSTSRTAVWRSATPGSRRRGSARQ